MSKYLGIACVFLALCSVFLWNRLVSAKKEIGGLEAEKSGLIQTIKDYQNAEVEANKTIKLLKEKARKDKESYDWYNTPIPSSIIGELQKRHNRNKR